MLGCLHFCFTSLILARMPLLSARLFKYLFASVSLVLVFARTHSCLSWLATFFLGMLADFVSAPVFRLGSHLQRMYVSFCGEHGASDFVFDYSSSFCRWSLAFTRMSSVKLVLDAITLLVSIAVHASLTLQRSLFARGLCFSHPAALGFLFSRLTVLVFLWPSFLSLPETLAFVCLWPSSLAFLCRAFAAASLRLCCAFTTPSLRLCCARKSLGLAAFEASSLSAVLSFGIFRLLCCIFAAPLRLALCDWGTKDLRVRWLAANLLPPFGASGMGSRL